MIHMSLRLIRKFQRSGLSTPKHRLPARVVYLIVPFAFFFTTSALGKTVRVGSDFESLHLGPFWEIAADETGDATIEEASNPQNKRLQFKPSTAQTPNFGFTSTVYWTRTRIENIADRPVELTIEVGYPLLDRVDLYTRPIVEGAENPSGTWSHRFGGDRFAFSKRELAYRNVTFRLKLPPNRTEQVYMRVETTSSMQMPFVLWQFDEFYDAKLFDQMVYGLIFGLMLVLLFYNLFLAVPTRDKSYLYFVVYMFGSILFSASLSGHSFQYLFSDNPTAYNRSIPTAMAFWEITATAFVRSFLNLSKNYPRIYRGCRIAEVYFAIIVVASLFGNTQFFTRVSTMGSIVLALSCFSVSVYVWRKGYRSARFLVLAWLFFLSGVIAYASKSLGLLPTNTFTHYSLDVGTSLGAVLIALALGDHIQGLRKEREKAQHIQLREQNVKASSMEEIKSLAADVAKVSKVMAEVMSSLSGSTNEVVSLVSDTTATVEEIEHTGKGMKTRATQIADASARTASDSQKGRGSMDETAAIVRRIKDDSQETSKMIHALLSQLEEVDSITTRVKSIAEASKILAVNASIEAASAGEYGSGFAVIAQEVKNLAGESKEATLVITRLLNGVRESIANVVSNTSHGVEQTEMGVRIIDHTKRIIDALADAVNENSEMASEIASSVKQQTDGLSQILLAIEKIGSTTRHNKEMSEKMKSGTGDLDTTVERLLELISLWGDTEDQSGVDEGLVRSVQRNR